ncbi:MAG: metallophosphoesterase [Victivallaceae bacterium]|nr:metallophosphoesterase [Victivallaceae bacterium]
MPYPILSLPVGATEPFRALHIADTHLLFADGRDNEAKFKIAQRRYGEYVYSNIGRNMPYFLDALQYTKDHCDLMLHTGDLIDFVSLQNLEVAKKLLDLAGIDYFMCAGNHEYTHYSGQHPETEEERAEGRNLVPKFFRNNLFFDSRVFHGVNLVAVDNGNYQFTMRQTQLLEKQIQRGLPIILLIHNPIFTENLARTALEEEHNNRLALAGYPPEALQKYADCGIIAPNKDTLEFLALLRSAKNLKAILAGHIHYHRNCEDLLWGDVRQFVVGGGYYGCGEVFEIC